MQTVFGEMVKRYRNHLGMTQKDLGEKLDISAQAVSGWEQNGKYPEVKLLPKLQRTLKIPYRVFMAGLEGQDVDSGVIEDHACKYCGKPFQVDDARRDFEGYYQRDGYKFLDFGFIFPEGDVCGECALRESDKALFPFGFDILE